MARSDVKVGLMARPDVRVDQWARIDVRHVRVGLIYFAWLTGLVTWLSERSYQSDPVVRLDHKTINSISYQIMAVQDR